MRLRLAGANDSKPSLELLLKKLGFETGEEFWLDQNQDAPRCAVWCFTNDIDEAQHGIEDVVRVRERERLPFVAVLPRQFVPGELDLYAAGCEGIVRRPIKVAALAQTTANMFSEHAHIVHRALRLRTLLIIGPQADAIAARFSADDECIAIAEEDWTQAERLIHEVAFELCIVRIPEQTAASDSFINALRTWQEHCAILVCEDESTTGLDESMTRGIVASIPLNAGFERLQAIAYATFERRSNLEIRDRISGEISEKQRELQAVNKTLRSINIAYRDSNLRLEREQTRKDELLSVAAHELKSPLAAMRGALDILATGAQQFNDSDRSLVALIDRNNSRMIKLVDDILDLARAESGRLVLNIRKVSPSRLVDQILSTLSLRAKAAKVEITIAGIESAPAFEADYERVLQILINLLDNAIKFSPPNGLVRLRAKADRQMLHFLVSDSGPGIAVDQREKVFERFHHRAHVDYPLSTGSGLGLTIAKALAAIHGGRIVIGDGPDGGAQFTVSLPLVSTETVQR